MESSSIDSEYEHQGNLLHSLDCGGSSSIVDNAQQFQITDSWSGESSSDSDRGSNVDGEQNPRDLFELYFLLYNTRYFVPGHITPKSNEFAT